MESLRRLPITEAYGGDVAEVEVSYFDSVVGLTIRPPAGDDEHTTWLMVGDAEAVATALLEAAALARRSR